MGYKTSINNQQGQQGQSGHSICKPLQQKYRACLENYNYQPGTKCSSLHLDYQKCLNAQFNRNNEEEEFMTTHYKVDLPPEQCRQFACDIQKCLEDHHYRGEKCREKVDLFNNCIKKASEKGAVHESE